MGIRLFVEVLEHAPAPLTWRERYALTVLAETANDDTRECWPGIEDDPVIARRMRLPARSSRYEVLAALREKKALETVESGRRGRRAVYRIPVLMDAAKGPETPDPKDEKGSGNHGLRVREPRTQSKKKGPGTTDPKDEKGSGNDLHRVRERPAQGPETPDPFPSDSSDSSSQQAGEPDPSSGGIPDFARPLVDGCTLAGLAGLRWPFHGNEWFQIDALIKKSGAPALVEYARRTYERQNGDVGSARYFLKGWRELPPIPAADTPRPQLRAVAGGWQPYRNPTDHSVYENGF